MIDWEKDDDYFSIGSYEKYCQNYDENSVNIQENSIFDIFKAVEKNEYISDLKSEGFLDSKKEFELFDKWKTFLPQAAPLVNHPTHINADVSSHQATTNETYLLESSFISRNPLIGNNFDDIKTSVLNCAPLLDDYNHNNNSNSQDAEIYPTHINADASSHQATTNETYLLESYFISRNPLIGNDYDDIKTSVLESCALFDVDNTIIHPRNLPCAKLFWVVFRLSNG